MIQNYVRFPRYLFYLISLSFIFSACSFFSDPVEAEAYKSFPDLPRPSLIGTAVYIYNNDIYWFGEEDERAKRITFSPESSKRIIALNSSKEKMAYLDEEGIPTITSVEGIVLESLPQSDTVLDMGWVPNSETLYMVVNNRLEFHGPDLGIPQPTLTGPNDVLLSASLSDNLDLAYAYRSPLADNRWYLGVDFKDPSKVDIINEGRSSYQYIRISPDGERVVYLTSSQVPENWGSGGAVNPSDGEFRGSSPYLSNSSSPVFMGNSEIIYGAGTDEYPYRSYETNVMRYSLGIGPQSQTAIYLSYYLGTSKEIFIDWKP